MKTSAVLIIVALLLASCGPRYRPWGMGYGGGGCAIQTVPDAFALAESPFVQSKGTEHSPPIV